jgi:mannitol/fructose-specific phosphotransferase system IIA component (Ntr-type)
LKKKDAVLHELAHRAHRAGVVRDPDLLYETLSLRERLASSALGKGVALPQARSLAVIDTRLIVARSLRGLDWSAADEQPVHLVLLALSPSEVSVEFHLDFLARAAAIARLQRNRQRLLEAEGFEVVASVLKDVAS